MGVKLDPNVSSLATLFRALTQETASPASAPQPVNEAPRAPGPSAYFQDTFESGATPGAGLPALSVPPGPLPVASGPQPVNEAAEAQARQQWHGGEAAVAQTTDTGCGEASLAQVKKAKDPAAASASDDQKRQEVRSTAAMASQAVQDRFQLNLEDGTRPEEMGAVLGSMGIAVTRGMANYDPNAINAALKEGQFGMAMVDSSALANARLAPGQQTQEAGALHWITIDGYNQGPSGVNPMDDQLRVQDPVNGAYWVSAMDLLKAMDAARIQHTGTGGLMLLQNRPEATSPEQRQALSRSNLEHTASLGNGNGIGSKRLGGSESS